LQAALCGLALLQVKEMSYSWLRKLKANTSTHPHIEYECGVDPDTGESDSWDEKNR
jgi:hypothetical protein